MNKEILAKLRISVKYQCNMCPVCVRMCVYGLNPKHLPLCLMLLRLITEAAHARAALCIFKYNFKCSVL